VSVVGKLESVEEGVVGVFESELELEEQLSIP
jgi:hypothetical protein